MDTSKTTILLIENDNTEVRSFKIDTRHIKNYKMYLAAACSAILLLSFIIFILFGGLLYTHIQNNGLTSRISGIDKQLQEVDSVNLKQKLVNIDNNVSMINSYLQNRGIIVRENSNGVPSSFHNNNSSNVESLEKKTSEIFSTLQNMPVGAPYNGPISSGYGYRTNPFGGHSGEFHPGVDFKGQVGDEIYATGDGIVERCDWYGGYGNAVLIKHSCGLETLFGHMTRVNVVQGQQVKAGDLIGFLGTTGRSTGPHVHYEIRKDGGNIDPVPFLKIN